MQPCLWFLSLSNPVHCGIPLGKQVTARPVLVSSTPSSGLSMKYKGGMCSMSSTLCWFHRSRGKRGDLPPITGACRPHCQLWCSHGGLSRKHLQPASKPLLGALCLPSCCYGLSLLQDGLREPLPPGSVHDGRLLRALHGVGIIAERARSMHPQRPCIGVER